MHATKTSIIQVTGKHIGSQYLKTEKAALLNCNSYHIEEKGKLLATFLAGLYHSGHRYFAFEINEMHYVVKKDAALFKDVYQIINRLTNEQIGKFQFGVEWFGKTTGTLTTNQPYTFRRRKAFRLFRLSGWNTYKFELSNQKVSIEYVGKYKQSAFSGIINICSSGKYLEAVLALFIIDERYRISQERVT